MKFYNKNKAVHNLMSRHTRFGVVLIVSALILSACGATKSIQVKNLDPKSEALITEFKQLKSLEKKHEAGNTALHIAIEKNSLNAVEYLLGRGVNVNAQNKNGTTALMMAAARSNGKISALLIHHKAKINLTDKYGYTAMFYAVEEKSAVVIKQLVMAGANPNIKAEFGWTVIMILAGERESYIDTIKLFHAKGVNLNSSESQFGLTALGINNMLQGDIQVFKYLVNNGAKVNHIDKLQRTPLIYALINKNYTKIRYLIEKGADPSLGLYKGLTPLMYAAAQGNSVVVKLLVVHGAKPSFRNKHGKRAIDYARKRRFRGIMSYLRKHR